MALTRAAKEELVAQYEQGLAGAQHAFVVGFSKISVAQADELRKRIRERGASYEVVKNRLALIAIRGKAMEELAGHFSGPTAVAFSNDDPVSLAKALTEFSKENPVLEFKAGLVEGQPVGGDEVKAIANLPSREELIAKLLFLLQSPISRLAQVLAAVPREFVVVLDQVRQKKEASA